MKEMSKARTVLFCIALFLSTFTIMWQMYEIVIVNDLYVAFPDNAATITGLLSWPSLVTALASMIAGPMLSKISTKTELVIAGVLMLAGIVPAYVNNIWVLLVCSLLMAFAAGISNTAGMTIIGEVFLEDKMRNSVIGWYSASMSIISAIMTMLGGVLAVNGWQVGFNLYWYVVPMLILCILFLPNVKPEDRVAEEEPAPEAEASAQPQTQKGFGKRFWMFFISVFIFCMAYCPFASFLSVYVAENSLGGSDFSGLVVTLTTVGSLIISFIFGALFSKMNRGLNVLCYILPIFVYLLMYLFPSVPMTIVGSLVYGFSYGGMFSFIYAYPAYVVPAEKQGTAMGLMTMNYSVAIFLGVYVASGLMTALGGTITAVYPFGILMLVVALCFEIPGYLKDRKEHLFDAPEGQQQEQ